MKKSIDKRSLHNKLKIIVLGIEMINKIIMISYLSNLNIARALNNCKKNAKN